ncbi:ester cyclase [Saccharopolyspora cebuensis]|uniref:Ester cyclase n=1 Tax=Saccharopolyspora cebuensis TaxID=418759 RepID=A0ABV4CP85_9PSEU
MADDFLVDQERTRQTRDLAIAFVEATNSRDLDAILDLLHPDVVHHGRRNKYYRDMIAQSYQWIWWSAFPDLHWRILDVIAQNDRAVTFLEMEGTQEGEYCGHAASGNHAKWRSIDISRAEDGKLIEHTGLIDEVHLLVQIGVLPKEVLEIRADDEVTRLGSMTAVDIGTRDVTAATQFYVDALGFTADENGAMENPRPRLTPPGGGAQVRLVESASSPASGMELRTTNLVRSRAMLEARGVVFDGESTSLAEGSAAEFHDPDGNRWRLVQRD